MPDRKNTTAVKDNRGTTVIIPKKMTRVLPDCCVIPPSRSAPQPVTQQEMPAGNTWEGDGRQMGWMVLVNCSGSVSSSSAMS